MFELQLITLFVKMSQSHKTIFLSPLMFIEIISQHKIKERKTIEENTAGIFMIIILKTFELITNILKCVKPAFNRGYK